MLVTKNIKKGNRKLNKEKKKEKCNLWICQINVSAKFIWGKILIEDIYVLWQMCVLQMLFYFIYFINFISMHFISMYFFMLFNNIIFNNYRSTQTEILQHIRVICFVSEKKSFFEGLINKYYFEQTHESYYFSVQFTKKAIERLYWRLLLCYMDLSSFWLW